MRPILLSASILSADFANLNQQLTLVRQAQIEWIHIDVMDGHFVPNITMGPFIVETCRKNSSLPLDVHLMIEKPERHINAFAQAGANWITVHVEGNPNLHRTIQEIHALGCKAGVAINPGTPAHAIDAILPFVDMVLVMTVNPGFSGQKFIPQMTEKIKAICEMSTQLPDAPRIQVDGGITPVTLPLARNAGADTFVASTAIFKHDMGIRAGARALLESAN